MEEFKPITDESKVTIVTIYGEKGVGKTTTAMSFPGKKVVLSFDKKAIRVKNECYNNSKNILIYDPYKYPLSSTNDEQYMNNACNDYDYVIRMIEAVGQKEHPEVLIIDGLEKMSEIIEMKMRKHINIKPFQGIPKDLSIGAWKYRKLLIRELHERAMDAGCKWLIYTTHSDIYEEIKDGIVITRVQRPKWFDAIMEETDVMIFIYEDKDKDRNITKRFAYIQSSKLPKTFKDGITIDITVTDFDKMPERRIYDVLTTGLGTDITTHEEVMRETYTGIAKTTVIERPDTTDADKSIANKLKQPSK